MTVMVMPTRINRKVALSLWQGVTLSSLRHAGPDFTARQLAILTTIYLEDGPHTIRSLAKRLHVTKAVISRAIDRLECERFVLRQSDPRDKRSVVIVRTGAGTNFLSQFADQICERIRLTAGPVPA